MSIIEFGIKKNNSFRLFIYSTFSIFMVFIAGFRTMGFDYEGYLAIYKSLQNISIDTIVDSNNVYVEPLFAILNIICKSNFQIIIFIMAVLNIAILFPFIYKYSNYPFFSILLYSGMFMYSGMMGLIRQSLAISLSLWAIVNLRNRKFWIYLLIAIGFHYSAVIIVAVKLIGSKILEKKNYLKLLMASIASNLFLYNIFILLCAVLPAVIAWKLNNYIIEEAGTSFGLNIAIIIRLVTFFYALFYSKFLISRYHYASLFINCYFLSIIVYIGFGFLPQMASRGAVYFHYFEIFLVPMIIQAASIRLKPIFFFVYAAFSLWRHIDLVTTYAEWYIPYKNILF